MGKEMVRYTIIGGGIQGTAIAIALIQQFDIGAVRIIDPHVEPLTEWDRNCTLCGVQALRSPGSHSLHPDVWALMRYAKRTGTEHQLHGRYLHPDYQLFMAHSRELIECYRVQRCWHQDRVERIVLHHDCVEIVGANGVLRSQHVICAVGKRYRQPVVKWMAGGRQKIAVADGAIADDGVIADDSDVVTDHNDAAGSILYLYDNGDVTQYRAKMTRIVAARRPLIVGGGISAIQLALSLVQRAPSSAVAGDTMVGGIGADGAVEGRAAVGGVARGEVATVTGVQNGGTDAVIPTVMARRQLTTHRFDSSPCFLGPDCLRPYSKLQSMTEKLAYSRQYRYAGSVPSVLRGQFDAAVRDGAVQFMQDEITECAYDSGRDELHITTAHQQTMVADLVILATGAVGTPLDTPILRHLSDDYGLPHSEGFPTLDVNLRWHHPRVYVTGYAAQSVLGLAAGNIFGAQLALRLLMPALCGTESDVSRLWHKNYVPPAA